MDPSFGAMMIRPVWDQFGRLRPLDPRASGT